MVSPVVPPAPKLAELTVDQRDARALAWFRKACRKGTESDNGVLCTVATVLGANRGQRSCTWPDFRREAQRLALTPDEAVAGLTELIVSRWIRTDGSGLVMIWPKGNELPKKENEGN